MFNQNNEMRGNYLALLIFTIVIIFPINWFYRLTQRALGSDLGLIALALITQGTLVLVIWGAIITYKGKRSLKAKLASLGKSLEVKLLGLLLFRYPDARTFRLDDGVLVEPNSDAPEDCISELDIHPRRIPYQKIRDAVLKWENRDKFNPLKIEDFLEQEFGSDNGVLRMGRSTFYDWRSRILGKGKKRDKDTRDNNDDGDDQSDNK